MRVQIVIIGSIFLAEIIAMIVIRTIRPMPYAYQTFLDAVIMTAMIFPVIYYLSFRPLLAHITQSEEAAGEIRRAYERQQELEFIVNQSPAIAFLCQIEDNWPIEYISQNIDQFGYTPAEFMSGEIDLGEVIHPDDLPRLEAAVREQVCCRGNEFDEIFRIRTRSGELRWLDNRMWLRKDVEGNATHLQGVALDITEHKKAEDLVQLERDKLKGILDSMSDGVYIVNRNYEIEYINPALEGDFGPVNGQKCYQYFHNQAGTCTWCVMNAVFAGRTVRREQLFSRNGKTYELVDTPLTNEDGTLSKMQILRDITQRKQNEEALRFTNQELKSLTQVEKQHRQLAEALVDATNSLNTSLALADVLDRIFEQIRGLIAFRAGDIALVEGDQVVIVRHQGRLDQPPVASSLNKAIPLSAFPLMQLVYESQEPVVVLDTLQGPGWQALPGMEWVRSYTAAPLISDGQTIGIMNFFDEQPGSFDQQTADWLMAFAASAALAIRNAKSYEAERSARELAETLSAASQAFTETLELDRVIEALLDHVGRLISFDNACVSLRDAEFRLVPRAKRGRDSCLESEEAIFPESAQRMNLIVNTLFAQRESLLIADTNDYSGWEPRPEIEHIQSWLGVPIIASDKAIGLLELSKDNPGFFNPRHARWAETLVGQAAVAIQNAWLFEQVRFSSDRLQSLAHQLVKVQENERSNIARELHDEAGQVLSSLKLSLGRLERDPECSPKMRQQLQDLKLVADGVLEDLHRMAMDLRPATLDRLGLVAALEQHVNELSSKELTVQFKALGFEGNRLNREAESSLYRIGQEALNNVVCHARASNVGVLLEWRGDNVRLFIEDDGVGFTPDLVDRNERLGLVGMRERAEMLGGRLTIESVAGKGTSVIVEVPNVDPDLIGG